MDIGDKIRCLKEEIKAKIEQALKNNQTEIVIAVAKILELVERLEKQHNEFERQYNEIRTAVTSFDQKSSTNIDEPRYFNKSPKQIGKDERKIFIQEASKRDIILSEVRGVLCRNRLGRLVGIAYAFGTEKNRWFLGLPKEEYHSIVFICKNRLKTLYFILPHTFCERYQNEFGIDEKETQYKFNIALKDGQYILTVSSKEINITTYIDKFDNLQ